MSISQQIIVEFQTKAREKLSSLALKFNLELIQEDEITFLLLGKAVEIRLYLYPSHVPSVNITLMPRGAQWSQWRKESNWGTTGIWLDHLIAFRKVKSMYSDMHFKTEQELCKHIETLIQVLCDVGGDLLQGDPTILPKLAAYADEQVQRKMSEAKLIDTLSSTINRKK
jgi:hypothetical protein